MARARCDADATWTNERKPRVNPSPDSREHEHGGDPRFEVGTPLDTAALGPTHIAITLLAMAAIVLDGFDLQVLAFAAPALIGEWGITRGDLAPIFAAGMVGVAAGGLLLGPRGDVWGRKPALIGSALVFGVATLACAWAHSVPQLLVLRLLAGVGLGGALSNATALVVETAPLRWRGMLTMTTLVGVPVGGFAGGLLAAHLIPAYGWQSVFMVGGVLPLALALALWLWLPESARFLLRANRKREAIAALNRLLQGPRFGADDALWLAEPPVRKASFRDLLGVDLRRDTLGIWLIFLANLFGMFCFMNWLPTLLTDLGHAPATANRMLAIFNLGGMVGSLATAWLIRFAGSRSVLAAVAGAGVFIAIFMGQANLADHSTALLLCAAAGVCLNSMQIGAYLLAGHIYPTDVRATGVGSAVAVGRIGALASSFAGALVGTGAAGASLLFGIVAGSMTLVVAGVLLVRSHVRAQD
jgi:AAHS family 4-hydroxybenzoate transporter-like MFS transporter